MLRHIKNIWFLGVKELVGLCRDYMMLVLIFYAMTVAVYITATSSTDTISDAPIALVDEDGSQISQRLGDAFIPPMFLPLVNITRPEIDPSMDDGIYTFVLVIPQDFERDLLAGWTPEIQINVDATRMSQAFTGGGYIQSILSREVQMLSKKVVQEEARLVVRNRYNPNLINAWFDGLNQLVNNICMLAIILTGSALIRERENGTLEHLMVMPVNAFEIMASKIWSMMLIVELAATLSVFVVVEWLLEIPLAGSRLLYLFGVALLLFALTSLGMFLACISDSMPQLGMLLILVLMPMEMLSGGSTPQESMPVWVQRVMLLAPTTHFIDFTKSILFRGAGIEVAWKSFAWLLGIGSVLFAVSLRKFRRSVA